MAGCKRPEEVQRCGIGTPRLAGRCCTALTEACTERLPPDERVYLDARQLQVGASDWEARGLVRPQTLATEGFWIDRHELTVAEVDPQSADPARALSSISREEARQLCQRRGGRLPTDAEWLLAAGAKRYPWGDTGLTCRRAAWGVVRGPCDRGASGPDSVGTHPEGQSAEGVHDLIGNVAEWVESEGEHGRARGGSYADDFAGSLRGWSSYDLPATTRDPRIGARCAYDR